MAGRAISLRVALRIVRRMMIIIGDRCERTGLEYWGATQAPMGALMRAINVHQLRSRRRIKWRDYIL